VSGPSTVRVRLPTHLRTLVRHRRRGAVGGWPGR
jgi:hypothetical protein